MATIGTVVINDPYTLIFFHIIDIIFKLFTLF